MYGTMIRHSIYLINSLYQIERMFAINKMIFLIFIP